VSWFWDILDLCMLQKLPTSFSFAAGTVGPNTGLIEEIFLMPDCQNVLIAGDLSRSSL
jgi:hypothetical protein